MAEPRKTSTPRPNVANQVQGWVASAWPELERFDNLWITGSSVWSHVYGEVPPTGSDLDAFSTTAADYLARRR